MAQVSSITFHYILKALEKSTLISIDEMLNQVNLSKNVLLKEDIKIDSSKLSDIFNYCMKKSGDYTLSLKIGSSITYHSLGILGYLLLNAKNLKEVIEKFDYYQKIISGFIKFHLIKDEQYYKMLIYINENPMIPVPNFHAEVHLSAIMAILNQIIGYKITPDLTSFSIGSLENIEKYKDIFGENIIFNKSENAILFKMDKLNIEINNSNPVMLEHFESQANNILETMQISTCYSKVKREILKNIGENEISIELIANRLHVSIRTLQYNLKAENKKFRDALLSVKMQLANHYIKNTKMDFGSIAILLGYKESSSFFRAYKKYYNQTPKSFEVKG
ncbi:AraC family transcriptional regulator [Arcobacter sp. F2176]|uniref:AraC family transcriptional regulator n=1 Tax=Arcobacter sp. F2176 TaxID=2044511 RepID=UPI00100AB00F|nr:AraC family transcriptional regulator [Arcobacter sp. F2176]RXJ81731.1 AraC family transcriptional regulator [Arcobacter sp. F2176]